MESKKLEDKHSKQCTVIHKDGNFLESIEKKISDLGNKEFLSLKFNRLDGMQDEESRSSELGVLFARIIFLSGIKDGVDDENKKDVKKMVLTVYKYFSLEDVWKAFELERFGQYEEKTNHFQLFNSQYVSEVFEKYKNWKQQKIKQYALNAPKKAIADTSKQTSVEYSEMMGKSVERLKNEFKETGCISGVNGYVYDFLFEQGKLPKDREYKDKIFAKAKSICIKVANDGQDRVMAKAVIDSILKGKSNTVVVIAKDLVLEEYFESLTK